MSYQLNIQAYELLIQIEVGIREFFISLIIKQDVNNWMHDFLGSTQREIIGDISKRISISQKANEPSPIQDIYRLKIDKAVKTMSDTTFAENKLFHPFYYLNWTDMENLLRLKQNSSLFEASIGKTGKELILASLSGLSGTRNDIAHSRFITNKQYTALKSAYDQIKALIENFDQYVANQSKEESIDTLMSDLIAFIVLISQKKILDENEISMFNLSVKKCLNSFWLSSLHPELVSDVKEVNRFLLKYTEIRKSIGAIWPIEKMILENQSLFNKLTN